MLLIPLCVVLMGPGLGWAYQCDSGAAVTTELIQLAQETAPAAALSAAIYKSDLPEGKRVGDMVLKEDRRNDKSGFHAGVYLDGKGKGYLVFEGTDMTSIKDWMANGKSAYGIAGQYGEAMFYAQQMKDKYAKQGVELTIAGHSLGGGLAQAASAYTGLDAYTFNPANLSRKLSDGLRGRKQAKVLNVVVKDEILNDVNQLSGELLHTSKVGETVFVDYRSGEQKQVAPTRPNSWNPLKQLKYGAEYAEYLYKKGDHDEQGNRVRPEKPSRDSLGDRLLYPVKYKKYQLDYLRFLKYQAGRHSMDPLVGYLDCVSALSPRQATKTTGPKPGVAAVGNGGATDAGSPKCRESYDASAALQLNADYMKAVGSSDYALLKQLRARKKAMDLWKKQCAQ